MNELLQYLAKEGLSVLRLRLIATGTQIVNGIRYALFLHYLINIFCFLTALSFFFSIYLEVQAYSESGHLVFNLPISVCLLSFTTFFGLLIYSVRESTWLRAVHLEEIVNSAIGTGPSSYRMGEAISAEQLSKIIEDAVEKKLRDLNSSRPISK